MNNQRQLGGKLGLAPTDKVTIYYDLINLETTPYQIFAGCPSEQMKWREAVEFADKKISSGEWKSYVIPALTGTECIFLEEDAEILQEEEENLIVCECGNQEEYKGNDMLTDEFTYMGTNSVVMYFMCNHCMKDVEFKI
jgi:hypothetical protein